MVKHLGNRNVYTTTKRVYWNMTYTIGTSMAIWTQVKRSTLEVYYKYDLYHVHL